MITHSKTNQPSISNSHWFVIKPFLADQKPTFFSGLYSHSHKRGQLVILPLLSTQFTHQMYQGCWEEIVRLALDDPPDISRIFPWNSTILVG